MTVLTITSLYWLGADNIDLHGLQHDPTTEEEFNTITYTTPSPITWSQFQTQFQAYVQTSSRNQLREYRDKQLLQTDWVMTYDNYITLANLEEWLTYRQQMRDLPSNTTIPLVWDHRTGLLRFEEMAIPGRPSVIRKTPSP
jgi:hypothetical protein